ncbi:MAG TPA: transcription termination/antitermination NusG family protein [Blastocatellia bacterium]|jgi:transcription elongation factor/antiterminator RfaH|nr:transcription termination/antitermination NusG family protein [Blastocatellia bacterium]
MGSEDNNSVLSWYVVHTNPRQEQRAEYNLKAWNVETFAPRVREIRKNKFTGEQSYVVKPLFAGYIFARLNLESLFHKVRFTRGVHSLVSFGDAPVPIEDEVIAMMESRVGKDGFVRIGEELKAGDDVVIVDGPLKDFTGVFEREMNDSNRVIILLNFINYQARIEIGKNQFKKFSRGACGS